ncbi:MAG: hypothetical protein KDI79_18625 [Anaerolineae bacterium]|nr:hypothetical protein [Anaerolineae bacterium]
MPINGSFMSEAGCAGVVAGVVTNIVIYLVVIGFELTYLGPLWLLPGFIGGFIGGLAGHQLKRTSQWSGIIGGAVGTAIAFAGMGFILANS